MKNILIKGLAIGVLILIGITFNSCGNNDNCEDYVLLESYNLRNFFTDTETYELKNNVFVDENKSSLDGAFDAATFASAMDDIPYFDNRTHFGINFNANSKGNFLDRNDSLSLSFDYNYIQDSVVIINSANSYEYKFYLNEDCKLEHCVYLVSTFKTSLFNDFEIIYSTYCLEKSFEDVAQEYRMFANTEVFDTIGINRYTTFEE